MFNGILVLCAADYRSFYINCGGGQDVKNGRILYEGEPNSDGSAAARNYHRPGSNWGFSSTGDFMDDINFNIDDKYTLRSNPDISPVVSELYTTARRTPLSITYYGYCLENGDYTVRLHFAEIQFTVTRRVFDIYIQGKLVKQDFNIKEAAKGSNRDITIAFNTTVINSTLEIRLYWAGKGSTVMPRRGDYGAIISAISVCSEPVSEPEEPEEASKKPIVIGVVTSAVFLIFLVMGVSYWKFCYGHKHTRERELKGLDLKTGFEGSALVLSWPTRYKICVGIARGLAFLHEGSAIRIVHRDIKGTNVLLDKDLNAKISDFGLAKLNEEENTHISTRVAGTIYRPENDNVCLLDWAFVLQKKGNVMEVVDPKLQSEFNKEEAERMIKLALLCTNASPSLRPAMSEAASMLEGQTSIPEIISDPSIYGDDLHSTRPTGHYQQARDHNLNSTGGLFPPSDKSWNGKSINLCPSETSSLIE
ncbi:hypothetical protein OIU84_002624 [Salix udensis]|uniref:non-specific serine/threonine protein kinase n=1 Tax=Salix udensis TaxID=889485 RepID=A0AAD6K4L7_9ROSI|nr:hypothetical protein OIU84_002624 [Salix udensis]